MPDHRVPSVFGNGDARRLRRHLDRLLYYVLDRQAALIQLALTLTLTLERSSRRVAPSNLSSLLDPPFSHSHSIPGEYISSGSCRPCTNAPTTHYYTGWGGDSDACPTTACEACPGAAKRINCGGTSAGDCTTCDADDILDGQYFDPALLATCGVAWCTNLTSCTIGECQSLTECPYPRALDRGVLSPASRACHVR